MNQTVNHYHSSDKYRLFSSLGYTQNEFENYFDEYIQSLCFELGIKKQSLLVKIKNWYDGYSWNAKDKMYNPFSILNLFVEQQFDNYWFVSGTPRFLMQLIKKTEIDVTTLENQKVSKSLFDSYQIENINIFVLSFQTGYLTISEIDTNAIPYEYTLNYPNLEVKQAFMTYLFEYFTNQGFEKIEPSTKRLREHLQANNLDGFMNVIRSLFAKIPYTLHINGTFAHFFQRN